MAKETLYELVKKLWDHYYNADPKVMSFKTTEDLYETTVIKSIISNFFGNYSDPNKYSETSLQMMLHLMGYPDNKPSPENTALAEKFRLLFWTLPACIDILLRPLIEPINEAVLDEKKKKNLKLDRERAFKSLAFFIGQVKPQHYLATRIVERAFDDYGENSSCFARYYFASDIGASDATRVEEAYTLVLNADKYFSPASTQDEEDFKQILSIRDPKRRNQTLGERLIQDADSRAESKREWLEKTWPTVFAFFAYFNPNYWKAPKAEIVNKARRLSAGEMQVAPVGPNPVKGVSSVGDAAASGARQILSDMEPANPVVTAGPLPAQVVNPSMNGSGASSTEKGASAPQDPPPASDADQTVSWCISPAKDSADKTASFGLPHSSVGSPVAAASSPLFPEPMRPRAYSDPTLASSAQRSLFFSAITVGATNREDSSSKENLDHSFLHENHQQNDECDAPESPVKSGHASGRTSGTSSLDATAELGEIEHQSPRLGRGAE